MKKGTKIILWGVVAIVLAGGAVGIYFLAKPKDGQTRTKKGVNQVYKDGKWEDVVTSGYNTTPSNGSGSGSGSGSSTGHKSCWDANVEKLQKYLNDKGAKLEVDGCRGNKTKQAEKDFKVTFDGVDYKDKEVSSNNFTNTTSQTAIPPKVGEVIYTDADVSSSKPTQIYKRASSLFFSVDPTPVLKITTPKQKLGTVTEITASKGVWYAEFINPADGVRYYALYYDVHSLK